MRAAALLLLLLPCLALGAKVQTYEDTLGTTLTLHLQNAPFPDGRARYHDDTVVVFVPREYRIQKRTAFLVHFHGHGNTARSGLEGLRIREQLVLARQNAILVAPQAALMASDSDPGKFARDGTFKRMMAEVMAELHRQGFAPRRGSIGAIVLSSHSGGFAITSAVLQHGGLPVSGVLLFDSLYGQIDEFARWIAADRRHRFASVVNTGGRPAKGNRALARLLREAHVPFAAEETEGTLSRLQLGRSRVLLLETPLGHAECAYAHLTLRDLLLVSVLPRFLASSWFKVKGRSPRHLEAYHYP